MLMKNLLLLGFLLFSLSISSNVSAHSSSGNEGSQDFFAPWDTSASERDTLVRVKYYDYHLAMLMFRHHDLEVLGVDLKRGSIDLYVSESERELVGKLGFSIIFEKEEGFPMAPDNEYKTPQEIAAFLQEIHQRFPEITKLVSLGKSSEGRDIMGLKISDNAELDEAEESRILFNGMHHAREVMTPEVGVDIIEYLTSRYKSDDKVTAWVDSYEIFVVPMLNVDGNNKVWGGSAMWRKNTAYGYGVDINRNYPHKWGTCNGSSGSTWSDTYRGPSAGSEPETKALMGLVQKIRPVFDISYHSYSELVIFPYGCEGSKTETHEVVGAIGGQMAKLLGYTAGTSWEVLYSVDGGDIDWMYNAYQVIPYVIEVNSSREGFQPSYSRWRQVTVEKNRLGWQLLLDKLSGPGLKGMVRNTDQSSDAAWRATLANGDVQLKVYKLAKDQRTLFQSYKVNPDSSYHIILNSGKYDFELVRSGRSVTNLSGIEIKENRINQDIVL